MERLVDWWSRVNLTCSGGGVFVLSMTSQIVKSDFSRVRTARRFSGQHASDGHRYGRGGGASFILAGRAQYVLRQPVVDEVQLLTCADRGAGAS